MTDGTEDLHRHAQTNGNTVKPADGEYEEGQSSKRQATEGILSRLPAAPRLAPVG